MSKWPYPAGTLVMGIVSPGIPVRGGCEEHVFVITDEASKVDYSSGWIQPARDLVCGYTTVPVDAEWWRERATRADKRTCGSLIKRERRRLLRAYDSLFPSRISK